MMLGLRYFYPRPPRGGRQADIGGGLAGCVFLSTPSARRATRRKRVQATQARNFYPRPPRGGRHGQPPLWYTRYAFLSTPSARRATGTVLQAVQHRADFYPRPPRGGRRSSTSGASGSSIFLSTPSARRTTKRDFNLLTTINISIHALREEDDTGNASIFTYYDHFYPRPPRGGRPEKAAESAKAEKISIHALREEDDHAGVLLQRTGTISIHALREEDDCAVRNSSTSETHFYPRPPRGGRHDTT